MGLVEGGSGGVLVRPQIDVVLESHAGEIVCEECKAAATVKPADYRAIARLRDAR